MPNDKLIDVARAAKRLGVSGQTVRNLIHAGCLPASRLRYRGHWRVRLSDVDALERRSTVSKTSKAGDVLESSSCGIVPS